MYHVTPPHQQLFSKSSEILAENHRLGWSGFSRRPLRCRQPAAPYYVPLRRGVRTAALTQAPVTFPVLGISSAHRRRTLSGFACLGFLVGVDSITPTFVSGD